MSKPKVRRERMNTKQKLKQNTKNCRSTPGKCRQGHWWEHSHIGLCWKRKAIWCTSSQYPMKSSISKWIICTIQLQGIIGLYNVRATSMLVHWITGEHRISGGGTGGPWAWGYEDVCNIVITSDVDAEQSTSGTGGKGTEKRRGTGEGLWIPTTPSIAGT